MPELRRTIRRISPEEVRLADEPWWPVFLALLVFAGFATGTVLAYMSFDAKHWHLHAATWLFVIGAVVLASFASTLFLPPRTVRRSLQLAIVLNLLFHLLIIVASLQVSIFGLPYAGERPSTLRSPRREARNVPDYPSMRMTDLRERIRENERPVETETPVEAREITPEAPSAEKREVTEEPTPNIPLPSTQDAAAEATSLPQTPSTRRADSMAESGPAEAQAVRFSESSSLMSRREVEQPDKKVARPVDVIPDPGQAPSATAKPELTARETDIAPGEAAVTPTTAATAPETSFPKATDSPKASDTSAPSDSVANATTAERQPVTERSVDSSAAAMARSNSESTSESLAAQSTSTAQSDSTPLPNQREVTSPSTGVAASSSRSQTPRATASALPDSQTIADSGNLRRNSENTLPSVTMAAPEASRVAGSAEATELSAAPTSSLAQQSGRESAGQLASQSTSSAPSGGADLRAATQSRTNRASTSAPAEASSGDASLPRAAIAASVARSPINAEAPDISGAGTTATGDPTTPTQTSITQAQSGVAGGGAGPNLDRSAPAGSSPAILPSGMARRETTAQASTPGEAFESSSSSVVRRSQTGAAAPSTTLRAEDTPYASTEGSERVSDLNAMSSAALSQTSSQAGAASNAMSQGTLDVDLGPTQIVAERGEGKGSGGGGPQISDRSFDTQARPGFASARSPGYVPSSIRADAAAGSTSTAEPASSQGSGPSAASLQASQLGGSGSQSLSSLAGREAPTSPSAAGGLASMAPGSKAAGGDSPAPSNMAESAAGSPSSRRSTSTVPSLAGVKADEVGGATASEGTGEPSLSAAKVAASARATEGASGPGMRAASGPPTESIAASGGGSTGRASSSDATPTGPAIGTGPALAMRGDSNAAPSVGTRADDVEEARNLPSDGTTDPGQGLALAPMTAKGSDVMRQGNVSLPVLLSAPDGAGGIGTEVGPDAGINRATAIRDSTNVDDSAVRLSRSIGALAPTTVASSSVPKEAFQSRGDRLAGRPQTPRGGSSGAPSPETEEAIERGLSFLASIQHADGRWSLAMPGEQTQITSDTAATALALLSFQGAGYTHREHKHKERIAAGLQFLVRNQKRSGDLFMLEDDHSNQSAALYSHALASIAVCEAYGMTQDPVLKEPAERALLYILAAQSPDRGGWRYVPQSSSDTSVSGWMLMALKSGQLSGIPVPERSLVGVRKWLDLASSKDSNGSLYVYNSFANETERQAHGKLPTPSMTAVGLLMRFYTGWNRDNASMVAGANYLLKNPPSVQDRDTYYWYYGTQVMFHMGGKYWEEWNRALHPMLIESQVKQGQLGGSWDPAYPVRDKWSAHGGRLYLTTMNLLSLEVYYRHLPLYEETAK